MAHTACKISTEDGSNDVSLTSIRSFALTCDICSFVQRLLDKDEKTPKASDSSYESAKLRVEDRGMKFTGQWHGALVIDMLDEGRHTPTSKYVHPDISCNSAASVIDAWLVDCEGHPACKTHSFFGMISESPVVKLGGPASIILPNRLILLSRDGEQEGARLVDTDSTGVVPYVALSYCWGKGEIFKTTTETLEDYKSAIPLDQLPQTLKDAFRLTRRIRHKYLWVDALCILQTTDQGADKREWEVESQKMGHIYANADIVLSVSLSASVKEGIFKKRRTPSTEIATIEGSPLQARIYLNHEIITSCRTKSNKWWEEHIEANFPLLSRGWAFQERMLATRIVHFTPSELVWECQHFRTCECGVVEHGYPVMNKMNSALRLCLKQPDDKIRMRQMWREIVNSYSVRKLTNLEDKLPALAGIAALFKGISCDIYAAGLWKKSMPFDLLWRYDQSAVLKDAKARSPSWSWISVDGAIKWPVSQNLDKQPLKPYIISTTYFEDGAEGVKVDCEWQPDRSGPWKLKLETRLVPVKIQEASDQTWVTRFETKWAVQVGDSELSPFWPDINLKNLLCVNSNDASPSRLYLIEIMKPRLESGKVVPGYSEQALVVRQNSRSRNEYERVGVSANVTRTSWTTRGSWFGGIQYADLILI